jgi:hypothetical protein
MARRVLITALALLAALPAAASAASVTNGGFEAGSLAGWHLSDSGAGDWFAYQGTAAPIGHHRGAAPVQAPPQGSFAAIADEANPATLILYQDLNLEQGSSYELSLLAYYDSYAPIAVPSPNTLATDEEALGSRKNQQFRIDLVRPGAPLDSLDPGDVLKTLFQTKQGGPRRMEPTRFSADLSAFAGETVRLRIAVAAHEEVLNAGVDAVTLSSASGGKDGAGEGNRLRIVRKTTNPRRGTARVVVDVPAAGWLTLKKSRHALRAVSARASRPRRVVLRLKLTPRARKTLRRTGRLRVRAQLGWEPDEGSKRALSLPLFFLLKKS